MMATQCELDSFVTKFRNICSLGYNATLTISSKNGQAHVGLDIDLGFLFPPPSSLPSQVSSTPRHRSPSYYRRLKKCYAARQNCSSSENDLVVSRIEKEDEAVQSEATEEAATTLLMTILLL